MRIKKLKTNKQTREFIRKEIRNELSTIPPLVDVKGAWRENKKQWIALRISNKFNWRKMWANRKRCDHSWFFASLRLFPSVSLDNYCVPRAATCFMATCVCSCRITPTELKCKEMWAYGNYCCLETINIKLGRYKLRTHIHTHSDKARTLCVCSSVLSLLSKTN